jgi:hypothetical protein
VDYSPTEAEIKTCYQKGRFHAKSYNPHPEKKNEPVSKKSAKLNWERSKYGLTLV